MDGVSFLEGLWFVLICILWLGYFVLEGFDFGVGMLLRAVAKDDDEKRAVIHSIGPVWDGNEVWLLVAGGATFAAFPQWYATLFSGFYLALFLILAALIVRGVFFELWGKRTDPTWRKRWEIAFAVGSFVPALIWGVGWANIVGGSPIGADGEFTGTLIDLLKPYALAGGLATLALFRAHGACYLELKTKAEIRERSKAIAVKAMPAATALVAIFLIWTVIRQTSDGGSVEILSAVIAAGAVVALIGASVTVAESPGKAFVATSLGTVLMFTALFCDLFPNAMVSSTSSAYDLTLSAAASSHYTLSVMTVVAVALVPVVLLYQGWTYWVFRQRLGAEDFGDARTPLDLIEGRRGEMSE